MRSCFSEQDPAISLWRRGIAEALGTLLLVVALAGSGATIRAPVHVPELDLIAGAMATAAALVGLIFALGPVSGGHFNPLITALQWLSGDRPSICTAVYCGAQILGALLGAVAVNHLSGTSVPRADPGGPAWALVVSELGCSFGLMLVVFGCARSGQRDTGPIAVGAWLAAAIIATPSLSYANPAITIAAVVSNGPVRVSMTVACLYVIAQILGALIALWSISVLYPRTRQPAVSLPLTLVGEHAESVRTRLPPSK
jgi:glycerol uptake facilitator-like aquaporin